MNHYNPISLEDAFSTLIIDEDFDFEIDGLDRFDLSFNLSADSTESL